MVCRLKSNYYSEERDGFCCLSYAGQFCSFIIPSGLCLLFHLFILLSTVMIRFFYYNRWLLEVNASPSLTASSPDDYDLKCRLLDDVLNVVDLENRFVQLFSLISSSICVNLYVILEPVSYAL